MFQKKRKSLTCLPNVFKKNNDWDQSITANVSSSGKGLKASPEMGEMIPPLFSIFNFSSPVYIWLSNKYEDMWNKFLFTC